METKAAPATPQARTSVFRSDAMQRVLAFGALILLFVVFTILSPYFLQPSNVIGILLATAVNGILALGVTFVIITAGIDLSIGTVMTLSSVMAGVFITMWQMPIALGVLAGLAAGALAGFLNGIIIARLKVPPFLATLGMLNIAKGLSLVISQLKPI